MIKVAVCGCLGRMGSTTVSAVECAEDMEVVCGIDRGDSAQVDTPYPVYSTLADALQGEDVDVVVDFTSLMSVADNIKEALQHSVDCVVGTTGLSNDDLASLYGEYAKGDVCLFYAPNFTTGAVLMMEFAKVAAQYFPQAEVIEYHHANKLDSPSGTAMQTARIISGARGNKPSEAPGKETEIEGAAGARGALIDGIPVHSVRSMGYVASQEVIFGSFGQTLTIRHDSWDRKSYMPGVLLGIRSVKDRSGLIIGLDNFMQA